jgi:DNA-binding MarR family transcriptional regulator
VEPANFDPEQSLAMLLDRANRCIVNNLQRIFAASGHDITVEQWMILLLLWMHNGLSQQQIVQGTGKDKGTISPQIDALEKKNLLVRVPDPTDKRRNLLYLTRTGKNLEHELVPLGIQNIQQAQAGIPEDDMQTCKRVLRTLSKNLSAGYIGHLEYSLHANK